MNSDWEHKWCRCATVFMHHSVFHAWTTVKHVILPWLRLPMQNKESKKNHCQRFDVHLCDLWWMPIDNMNCTGTFNWLIHCYRTCQTYELYRGTESFSIYFSFFLFVPLLYVFSIFSSNALRSWRKKRVTHTLSITLKF